MNYEFPAKPKNAFTAYAVMMLDSKGAMMQAIEKCLRNRLSTSGAGEAER